MEGEKKGKECVRTEVDGRNEYVRREQREGRGGGRLQRRKKVVCRDRGRGRREESVRTKRKRVWPGSDKGYMHPSQH